jgi:hypothetical protein
MGSATTDGGSRQMRRRQARQLIEAGRKTIARGLGKDVTTETALAVGLAFHDALTDPKTPDRASNAAALAETLLDRSTREIEATTPIACRRGCWHCCVTVASVTPPEVFRVANWLMRERRASPTLSPAAVIARCDAKIGPSLEAMFAARVPCPAMVNQECGVHAVRPVNCRQFFSLSVEACIDDFNGGATKVPFVQGALDYGVLIRCILLGAVQAAGLPDRSFELAGALKASLTGADTEARWLAGEDVFGAVLATPRPASTQEAIDHWAGLIREAAA